MPNWPNPGHPVSLSLPTRRSGCRLLFFVWLLAQAMVVYSQGHSASEYREIYQKAERYYNAEPSSARTDSLALVFYQRLTGKEPGRLVDDSLLGDAYLKCGIVTMSGGRQREALAYFRNAVGIGDGKEDRLSAVRFKALLYMGSCHYDLYEADSALYFYRRAEMLQARFPEVEDVERLYNKIGVLFYEQGDYSRSIPYFQRAYAIAVGRSRKNIFLLINYQNNIASALLRLKRYAEAIEMFKRLLPTGKYSRELRFNIGGAYLGAGDIHQALIWLRSADYRTVAGRNMLARAWLKSGRADSAEFYLRRRPAGVSEDNPGSDRVDEAKRLQLMGDVCRMRGLLMSAIAFYQRSVVLLSRDFTDTAGNVNPTVFFGVRQPYDLFDVLRSKAEVFRQSGELSGDPVALRNSLSAYSAALSLARHVQRIHLSDEARLFLAGTADSVNRAAVALAYRLFVRSRDMDSFDRLFGLVEAGKASVLQSRLGDPGPPALTGKARVLAMEEKEKRGELARLRLQLAGSKDSIESERLLVRVRDVEVDISEIQDRLDQYPEYQRRKFGRATPRMEQVRQSLPDADAALLSYYDDGDRLFCSYITQDSYGCEVVPWGRPMAEKILTLHRRLNEGSGDRQAIQELVDGLSDGIIKPLYAHVGRQKRWVIIPDQELLYLPFELLHAPGGKDALVFRHAVSYTYSAHLMTGGVLAEAASYQVLALAPFETGLGGWPSLSGSSEEIKGLPGLLLTGGQATRAAFVEAAGRYPIVHLATHAIADGNDPMRSFIAFAKEGQADTIGKLYEPAICQLDMSGAKLVILSACRTADGPLVQSEGVISLSRAFSYAGCGSVITSVWKADDESTAYLVRRLHHYLQEGFAKDLALQQAKVDYLQNKAIGARRRLPEYWAHLVLTGDVAPVVVQTGYINWLLGTLLVTFLWGGLILEKKKTGRDRPHPAPELQLRDEA